MALFAKLGTLCGKFTKETSEAMTSLYGRRVQEDRINAIIFPDSGRASGLGLIRSGMIDI